MAAMRDHDRGYPGASAKRRSKIPLQQPRVRVAHRLDDVRVEVDHLATGGDQGHDHDQGYQGEDEGVLDHSLSRLGATYQGQHPTR